MKRTEKLIRDFMVKRDWINLPPDDLAKSISIESAELLELFQWNSPTVNEVKADKELFRNVQMELADVLIYCFQLAITLNVNPESIIETKLMLANKKYPARLMRKRSSGDGYATKEYLEIKKNFRKNK